jgi:hypothetical protein
MNVYTHVSMGDLHNDVESLPGIPGNVIARPHADVTPIVGPAPTAPAELAGLISAWKDLPDNVRSAIAALAGE